MMQGFRFNRILNPSIPAALLALFAVIIAVTATRWGIGVENDSVTYLNLWLDPGHAPLLRWVHAALGGLGVDTIVASRWLFVFLLTVNIVVVYYALYWATRSLGASFLGAVLVFAAPAVLRVHLIVYSEPLYLLFGLIGLLLLSRHLETEKLGFLVLSAVAIALAFLSRFVGVALVVTGGLSILLWSDKSFSRRILHSIIFAIISIAPIAIYVIYRAVAYGTAGTAISRSITPNYTASVGTLASIGWILVQILKGRDGGSYATPGSIEGYVVGTAALVLILLAVAYAIQRSRNWETGVTRDVYGTLPQLLALFIPCYLVVWFVATMGEALLGVGAMVRILLRHMLPVYFAGVLLAVLLVNKVLKPQRKLRFVYVVIVVLSIGLTLNISFQAISWAKKASTEGLGYMSKNWRESELIKYVQSLDPSMRVYTNGIAQMVLYTRANPGQAQLVPFKYDHLTGRPNSSYMQELEGIETELKRGKAVLVMFSRPERFGILAWHPSEEEIQAHMSLDVVRKNPEGGVYTAKK